MATATRTARHRRVRENMMKVVGVANFLVCNVSSEVGRDREEITV